MHNSKCINTWLTDLHITGRCFFLHEVLRFHHHWIHTEASFCVCAVYLSHRKPDVCRFVWVLHNKVPNMVIDPNTRISKIALGLSLLSIGSRHLEAHWLYVPAMDVLWAINPSSKPLEWSAKMNAVEKAISTFWEAEFNLPSNFKPPNVWEISNLVKSARKATNSWLLLFINSLRVETVAIYIHVTKEVQLKLTRLAPPGVTNSSMFN
jgi:hypothetical protein